MNLTELNFTVSSADLAVAVEVHQVFRKKAAEAEPHLSYIVHRIKGEIKAIAYLLFKGYDKEAAQIAITQIKEVEPVLGKLTLSEYREAEAEQVKNLAAEAHAHFKKLNGLATAPVEEEAEVEIEENQLQEEEDEVTEYLDEAQYQLLTSIVNNAGSDTVEGVSGSYTGNTAYAFFEDKGIAVGAITFAIGCVLEEETYENYSQHFIYDYV